MASAPAPYSSITSRSIIGFSAFISASCRRDVYMSTLFRKFEFDAIDQCLETCIDNILTDSHRTPGVLAIGGFYQHPCFCSRAGAGIQDSNFVVGELHILQMREELRERISQSRIECVDWPVSLSNSVGPLFAHANFHGRFASRSIAIPPH